MNCPKTLCKYVPPERVDILRNGLIRFTQPSALNDPFEMQPVFDALFPENQMDEILSPPFEYIEESLREKYQELSALQKALISEDQLIALVKSNPGFLEMVLKDVQPQMRDFLKAFAPQARNILADGFDKNIGMLSLTENPESLLMWSHYAAAHKGFVIEFDSSDEFFHRKRSEKDEFYHLRKVRYLDRNASGKTLYDLDGEDVMLTKMKIWDYESEWRMLLPLKDAEKILESPSESIYLFNIPTKIIKGIVLGAKASSDLKSQIGEALGSYKCEIPIKFASLVPTAGAISVTQSYEQRF
jgi:hypothetical protein